MMTKIRIDDEIDIVKIADSGQCFRAVMVQDGEKPLYRFITGKNVVYIRQLEESVLEISCSDSEWKDIWWNYFDLNRNYKEIRENLKYDEYMKNASDISKGMRILRQEPFETLISFIISQRKSIPAIRSSIEKLCREYGTPVKTNYETVYTFPEYGDIIDFLKLNNCSLGYRVPYIEDAVEKVCSGQVSLEDLYKADNDTLMEKLKSIKGVGEKVANCVSLFCYNRVDRVPIDTWISKIINEVYDGTNPFDDYGDVAGIVQQYVFYKIQLTKSIY